MDILTPQPKSRAWLALFNGLMQARLRAGLLWLGAALSLAMPVLSSAQDDPPGRVGRLAQTQGAVSWFDQEQGRWGAAEINRPLTSGDRVSTGAEGRAELRVGSSTLRLGAKTELEVLRLDDQRLVFQVHSGSLALRIRSREIANELELLTAEARFLPQRAGHYRIDREDERSVASVWRGSLQVVEGRQASGVIDGRSPSVETGQSLELWRDGRPSSGNSGGALGTLRLRWDTLASDGFAAWVQREDQQDSRHDEGSERSASRYVSPEMTGAEELDRHGRWDQHPDHGAIWLPSEVASDWAPYRYGRWTWVRPWGWTWVDHSRWGFAPFHYGRWVQWGGRWGWCPGDYVARPIFAPALVARVGGPHVGVTVSIGLPPTHWVPLAPRERFVPHYRHSPQYVERINVWPGHRHGHVGQVLQPAPLVQPNHPVHPNRPHPPGHVQPVPTGPVMYGQQGVPGAVTSVSRDVLQQRQPAPAPAAVIDTRQPQSEAHRGHRGDRDRDDVVVDLRRVRPTAPAVVTSTAPVATAPTAAATAAPAAPAVVVPPLRPRPEPAQRVEAAPERGRERDRAREPTREEGQKRNPESRQNLRERQNQQ